VTENTVAVLPYTERGKKKEREKRYGDRKKENSRGAIDHRFPPWRRDCFLVS
jgi:hypothetical protein